MIRTFVVFCSFVILCAANETRTTGHDGHDAISEEQLRRIKLSAQKLAKYVEKPDNKDSELILKGARELDSDDCLLRTICDITSHPDPDHESVLVKKIRNVLS